MACFEVMQSFHHSNTSEYFHSTSFVNCVLTDANQYESLQWTENVESGYLDQTENRTTIENDQLPSSDEVAQFWQVDANAVHLLDQFKNLAVVLHDYLYKPPKRDSTVRMADRGKYLQGLDKRISDHYSIGQLNSALHNILHDVPKVLGKRWICLAADLRTFQFNAEQWITDQHVIDNLNAAIKTIINADFALMCNKYNLSVYGESGKIIQQVGMLMEFLRANDCQEPKLEFGGYEEIIGIMYIQS
jgi:hypothetical protein